MFPRAVHANGSSLGGVLRAVGGHLSARHQERELQEVSFIQGNLAHHLLVHYLTHRRSVGWNQRGCRINNYGWETAPSSSFALTRTVWSTFSLMSSSIKLRK